LIWLNIFDFTLLYPCLHPSQKAPRCPR
jgi:hypothetical protein